MLNVTEDMLLFAPIMAGSALLAGATVRRTPGYAKGRTINIAAVSIMAVASAVMFALFGIGIELLKGILLTDIFLYASICDCRERRVSDWVHPMILILGLISVSGGELLWNALAGFAAFVFFFITAVLSGNKIGGADVKFISVCMFVCGAGPGTAGLMLGLLLSVIGTCLKNRVNKTKDKTMPMIPYLSIGFLTAFITGGLLN